MSGPDGSQDISAMRKSVWHRSRRVTFLVLSLCLFGAIAVVWAVVGSPRTSDDGVRSVLLEEAGYGLPEPGLRTRPENVDSFIKNSSAIVYCEYRRSGALLHGYVASVIMLRPGTTLPCSVGDRLVNLVEEAERGVYYGDGALVFLFGSPARITDVFTVSDGGIPGLDEMPLDELVNKVKHYQPSRAAGVNNE